MGKAFTKFGTRRGRMMIRSRNSIRSWRIDCLTNRETDTRCSWRYPETSCLPGRVPSMCTGGIASRPLINQHIFKVIPEGRPDWFVYHAPEARHAPLPGDRCRQGTTMGHIKRADLHAFLGCRPPDLQLSGIWRGICSALRAVFAARKESETLTQIRDRLLPRLISGRAPYPAGRLSSSTEAGVTSSPPGESKEDAYAEQPALQWLAELGWEVSTGRIWAPTGRRPSAEAGAMSSSSAGFARRSRPEPGASGGCRRVCRAAGLGDGITERRLKTTPTSIACWSTACR